MSANPITIIPHSSTNYSSITDPFILQSPVMTWNSINGNGISSFPLFTVTATSFPKNMTIQVEGDFQLYDGTYHASFDITGGCSLCIPSSGNIFSSAANLGNAGGTDYATDNPSPYIQIIMQGNPPTNSGNDSVQFTINSFLQTFATCTITGTFMLKCSNLNGLDSISFP